MSPINRLRLRFVLPRWSVIVLASLTLGAFYPSSSARAAEPKVRLFVGDFVLDGVAKEQAGGLSPQLCNEMAMRKSFDIDCEHDLRALAGFEGNRVLIGDPDSPGAANILKRLNTVEYVVRPELHNTQRGLMIVVHIGEKIQGSDGNLSIKSTLARVVRKTGQRKMGPILAQLPNIVDEIDRAVKSAKVAPPATLKKTPSAH